MIKLIAADMDGTLLNSAHRLDDRTVAAIKNAQARGVSFVMATGRILSDVVSFLAAYDIHCDYLTMNGAEYYDAAERLVQGIYIPEDKAREILAILRKFPKFNVELYTNRGHFSADPKRKTLKGMFRRMIARSGSMSVCKLIWNAAHDNHFRQMQYIEDMEDFWPKKLSIGKFITFGDTKEEMDKLRGRLATVKNIAVTASFYTNIEINAAAATKGEALRRYIASRSIKPEEVMVLGDGQNDLSMFQAFPQNSVAMANAIPELKKIAAHVTASNNEGGVALAIEKYAG
ncbi:MAG: HAD family phosphatase [Selenomonadaceae bacterium]|nr:HAD family phosphatase [Selenomonadaceae bacterium]